MRVTLEGPEESRETIEVRPDETILKAAERAELGLPFGCRTGACATCTGRLITGEVEHRRPPRALKEPHLEQGYMLPCIAEPRSDCRIETGASIQAELVKNPWR